MTPSPNTKCLCVCAGGRVRSVAMRFILTDKYGCDALACGIEKNSPQTIAMLAEWAEVIFAMEPRFVAAIPRGHAHKIRVVDVGEDRWGTDRDPELRELCWEALKGIE
jgi:predicted protein tyrosine phosphatase